MQARASPTPWWSCGSRPASTSSLGSRRSTCGRERWEKREEEEAETNVVRAHRSFFRLSTRRGGSTTASSPEAMLVALHRPTSLFCLFTWAAMCAVDEYALMHRLLSSSQCTKCAQAATQGNVQSSLLPPPPLFPQPPFSCNPSDDIGGGGGGRIR